MSLPVFFLSALPPAMAGRIETSAPAEPVVSKIYMVEAIRAAKRTEEVVK